MSVACRMSVVLGAAVLMFTGETPGQQAYWAESEPTRVRRIHVDGSDFTTLFSAYRIAPWGIHFDSHAGKLYWCDWRVTGIRRSNMDGTAIETLGGTQQSSTYPIDVVVDDDSTWIYWTEMSSNSVARRNLHTGELQQIFSSPSALPTGIAIDSATEMVYWGDYNGMIFRSNPDGTGVIPIISGPFAPWGLDVDSETGKLYWCDTQSGSIRRANLDGSSIETITGDGTSAPWVLAIDHHLGRLFWLDKATGQLASSNLDGKDARTIMTNLPIGTGLACDPGNQRVYWAEGGSDGRIGVAQYDGSVQEPIVETDRTAVCGLAVDTVNSELLWGDCGGHKIRRTDFNGVQLGDLFASDQSFIALAIDNDAGKLYWLDQFGSPVRRTIRRANINGSNIETVIANVDDAYDFALDAVGDRLYWYDYETGHRRFLRASANGGDIEILFELVDNPWEVAVDAESESIYWSTFSTTTQGDFGKIWMSDMEGANRQVIRSTEDFSIKDIAVDTTLQRLIWIETSTDSMRLLSSNLDGQSVDYVWSQSEVPYAHSLAIVNQLFVISTAPASCAIDARQPHELKDPSVTYGWESIELTFSEPIGEVGPGDFVITEIGGDGLAPEIALAQAIDADTARITLASSVQPGAWTCFRHVASGLQSCIGYLPGDVNGDGMSSTVDVLRLVDSLNGQIDPPLAEYQTDINRSGASDAADVLRLIDLFNGADTFESWLGRSLAECP